MSLILVLAVFAALLLGEERCRAESGAMPDLRRMMTNWGLAAINWLLLALVPLGAIAAAMVASAGPLSALPPWLAAVPLLLARSLGTYGLHRLFHAVPLLWRIHAVHHADPAIDVSTGLRNHPAEALSAAALAAIISLLLAPPAAAVVAVAALLLAAAFWTHAAIRLPPRLCAGLERLFVTPRLHLVHHSRDEADHDRNFGDLFILWDRLFGTFKPARGGDIRVGLEGEDAGARSLSHQLALPFRR